MNKIVFIFFFVSVHASICIAQISGKIDYDKDNFSLKMTISNLYEDTPVILKSDNVQAREVELLQSFSDKRGVTYVDRSNLLDITLYFYDKNETSQGYTNIRLSDMKLQETAIAPLDSVTCTIFCLDPKERNNIHKTKVVVKVPYFAFDGKMIEGNYFHSEDIYLPAFEE